MKSYLIFIFICFSCLPIFGNNCYFSTDTIKEKNISNEVIDFAKTLIGTPYKYASQEPHFNIKVPRISREFASIGKEIMVEDANIGDIILFTGTNTNDPTIGHVGIITSNDNDNIQFIHSSSGKNIGVIISNLEGYYQTRLVKIIQLTN